MKNGDRIECTHGGKTVLGFAHKVTKIGVQLVLDSADKVLNLPIGLARPSNAPVPADSPFAKTFAKGDMVKVATKDGEVAGSVTAKKGIYYEIEAGTYVYTLLPSAMTGLGAKAVDAFGPKDKVEFDEKGRTVQGTVVKKGARGYQVLEVGGHTEYTVPAAILRRSARPDPVAGASVMDKWGVKGYREVREMSQETACFTAKITLNGTPVIEASNSGHGGCNSYHAIGNSHAVVRKFDDDLKAWVAENGIENFYEPDTTWIDWARQKDFIGQTAGEHLVRFNEDMKEAIGGVTP